MSITKRDRIAAVFHNEKTDRVPVGFWHHFTDNPRGENAFLHPEIADTVLAGQAEFAKSFSPDLIKIMTDGFFGYSNPILNQPLADIREAAQIKPIGKDNDWYQAQIHYAKRYVEIYGKEIPLFYNLFAPVRTLAILQSNAGQDSQKQIIHWIQEEPEALKHVLNVISEDYSLLAKGLIEEAGVDGIYLSVIMKLRRSNMKILFLPEKFRSLMRRTALMMRIFFISVDSKVSIITLNGLRTILYEYSIGQFM